MKLSKKFLVTSTIHEVTTSKDNEGYVTQEYTSPQLIEWVVQHQPSKLLISIYGERAKDFKTCLYVGDEIDETAHLGYGVCLDSNDDVIDYKIIEIDTYTDHKIITLEKV